ncbi:MAG: hypothetical protein WC464_06390, partial [Bdellovibrionales bacterium]
LSFPRIILSIGDDGIVIVPHDIPNTAPFFVSANDAFASQEITDFVALYPQARITLLVDTLSQDYRCADLPPINFFDRTKLIRRRLEQTFPSARITASLHFKNSPHRALMIGLHESNSVFAWADRLRKRLPDIALLPVEGTRLMAQLMPEAKDGWAMMISRQQSGGYRQIVTFKNDLVFTRLTPLPPANDGGSETTIIARDIKASLDYLTRHGLREPKELSVLLLMPNDIHEASALKNLFLGTIRSLPPAHAARLLALSPLLSNGDYSADILFAVHFLNAFRPRLSLMLPDEKKQWLTKYIRLWGTRTAYACLTAAGILTLWRAGDLSATLYQTQKSALQLVKTRYVLAEKHALAAPLTEPLGRMRQALELRHIYEKPTLTPWQGLNQLASGLDEDSKIVKLEWRNNSDTVPERLIVSLHTESEVPPKDRSETVAAFTRVVQNISQSAPDYIVTGVKPPYPSLPDESVTAAPILSKTPIGEIIMERKSP